MSHKKYVALGVWIILLPFLGFPSFIKSLLFVLTGIYLIFVGYKIYRKKEALELRSLKQTKTFTEVAPQQDQEEYINQESQN